VEIWRDVLSTDHVGGVRDSFFDLGGHSLLAMRVGRAHGQATRSASFCPLATLFEAPTIEDLAAVIRRGLRPASGRASGRHPGNRDVVRRVFVIPGLTGTVLGATTAARPGSWPCGTTRLTGCSRAASTGASR